MQVKFSYEQESCPFEWLSNNSQHVMASEWEYLEIVQCEESTLGPERLGLKLIHVKRPLSNTCIGKHLSKSFVQHALQGV